MTKLRSVYDATNKFLKPATKDEDVFQSDLYEENQAKNAKPKDQLSLEHKKNIVETGQVEGAVPSMRNSSPKSIMEFESNKGEALKFDIVQAHDIRNEVYNSTTECSTFKIILPPSDNITIEELQMIIKQKAATGGRLLGKRVLKHKEMPDMHAKLSYSTNSSKKAKIKDTSANTLLNKISQKDQRNGLINN